MTRDLFILIFLISTFIGVRGQNNAGTYQIKISKYSFKSTFRPPIDAEKSYSISINIPKYIRSRSFFDQDGNNKLIIDTVDHFSLTYLDSIPLDSISILLSSRLQTWWNEKKTKVTAFGLEIYKPDKEPFVSNITSDLILHNKSAATFIKKCPTNSYIVFYSIAFVPVPGQLEQLLISDRIGLKIIGR